MTNEAPNSKSQFWAFNHWGFIRHWDLVIGHFFKLCLPAGQAGILSFVIT